MNLLVFAMLGMLQTTPQNMFSIKCDLQGLYDEIAQATLSARSAKDVDLFHDVFYTSGWLFVDGEGKRLSWTELRDQTIETSMRQKFTSMRQVMQDVTLNPDGATVLINYITVRTIVDNDGKYGPIGATHTIAEVIPMRDTWIKTAVSWKLQLREQLGGPRTFVDKLPPDFENPRCPT
ncbi:MAG: hypothetical protein LAO77_19340 [Acidobacteriia bacterium]|nr:hypothetical protein [Terriglobia bacterium]